MNSSHACKHLRSKKMFIPALADEALASTHEMGHSSHCWCNCTLTETGPDDQLVAMDSCKNGRACFEE